MTGRRVQILKTPPGCCGVLRFGHEGVVAEVVSHHDLEHHGNILILEDGTLVWECDVILLDQNGD
jgi:hypothetical protein